jgi:hypothetical protein
MDVRNIRQNGRMMACVQLKLAIEQNQWPTLSALHAMLGQTVADQASRLDIDPELDAMAELDGEVHRGITQGMFSSFDELKQWLETEGSGISAELARERPDAFMRIHEHVGTPEGLEELADLIRWKPGDRPM